MYKTKIELTRLATATFAELDAMLKQACEAVKEATNHSEWFEASQVKMVIDQTIERRFG